jgi:two-component system sensor histidine kinase BaeS
LPRLFEPLFRADASRSRQSGGSGLGLAICQALVRSHGGRITAAASPLGGLRVAAHLPLWPFAAEASAP